MSATDLDVLPEPLRPVIKLSVQRRSDAERVGTPGIEGVTLQLDKTAESGGLFNCYVYLLMDA